MKTSSIIKTKQLWILFRCLIQAGYFTLANSSDSLISILFVFCPLYVKKMHIR